jgi:hypothetical protein
MSNFQIGNTVKANLDAQGMIKDHFYTVANVRIEYTPFGAFTTYTITDGVKNLTIGNGHLLLTKVFIAKKRGA